MEELTITEENKYLYSSPMDLMKFYPKPLFINLTQLKSNIIIEGIQDKINSNSLSIVHAGYRAGTLVIQPNDMIFIYFSRFNLNREISSALTNLCTELNKKSSHMFEVNKNDLIIDEQFKCGSYVSWEWGGIYITGVFFSSKNNEENIKRFTTKPRKFLSKGFSELDLPLTEFSNIIKQIFYKETW